MNGWAGWPQRAPRLTVATVLVGSLLLGVCAFGFRVDSAVDQLLPDNDPDRRYYDGVRDAFGSEEIAVVGVFADDVFAPATLRRVQDLTRELERIDGVREVASLSALEGVELGARGLGKERLMPPLPHAAADTEAFRRRALAHRLARRTMVAPDGRATGVSVWFEAMSDVEFQQRKIEEQIRTAVARIPGPEAVAVTGLPTIKVLTARAMLEDLAVFVPLGILVVVLVLFWAFRTWRGVLLPLSTVLIGVIWTTGVMVLTGGAFTMGTIVLPPLLIAVGTAYAIHVVSRYYQELRSDRTPGETVARTMAHVRMPVAMAAATTVAGFATFLSSPIPSIRDFGVYSAFGIATIFGSALTVIPAVLTMLPRPTRRPGPLRDDEWVSRTLVHCGRWAMRHRRVTLLIGGVIAAVSLWGIGRIRIETDYLRFFSPTHPVRVENAQVGDALAGTQLISVVVDGEGPESVTKVETLQAMRALQHFAEQQPGVGKTMSVLDYVDMVRHAIDPQTAGTPFANQREVDQLLLLVNPVDTRRMVNRDFSRASITVYTRLSESQEVRELVGRIEGVAADRFPPGVRVHATGTVVLLNRSAVTLATGQIAGLRQVFAVLLVLMTLLFRSVGFGLLSLVPNAVPIVVLFGVMGWAGVDLNVSTSMIAAVAVGIAVDDTIHYMRGFCNELRNGADREAAVLTTAQTVGRPIVITSVALSAGFLIVCLSNFQPIRHFGGLTSITMAVALLADVFLLPALLVTFRIGEAAPDARAAARALASRPTSAEKELSGPAYSAASHRPDDAVRGGERWSGGGSSRYGRFGSR